MAEQHADDVRMEKLDVSEIVAALVGQHDGKVFIPRQAVEAIRRMVLCVEESHDFAKDGWYVWLELGTHSDGADNDPALIDGGGPGGSMEP